MYEDNTEIFLKNLFSNFWKSIFTSHFVCVCGVQKKKVCVTQCVCAAYRKRGRV